jgi:hypothetical protein
MNVAINCSRSMYLHGNGKRHYAAGGLEPWMIGDDRCSLEQMQVLAREGMCKRADMRVSEGAHCGQAKVRGCTLLCALESASDKNCMAQIREKGIIEWF